jgi:hypothetical protein
MIEGLSWLFSVGLFVLTLFFIRTKGFLEGGRPIWIAVLLLVPTWFEIPLGATRVDPRSTTALAVLIGFLIKPYDIREPFRWFFSDLCICLLMLGMTVSQVVNESLSPLPPLDQFRDVALPYIVGRLFLMSARDIHTALPSICAACSLLAALSIFEGVSSINPIDQALGKNWDINEWSETAYRWGLKRANGPQSQPIYLGMTLALMMPWLIEAARCSWRATGPYWWRFVPFIAIGGLFCSGSRAAQITVVIVLIADAFHNNRRWRIAMVLLALIGGLVFFAARDEIVDALSQYAEERTGGPEFVIIDGKEYPYTGTSHRDLLQIVYKEASDGAGWFGYGMLLRKAPRSPNMDARFRSIDNHYLLFYLQYGAVGITLFALLAASLLWNVLPAFLNGDGATGRLAAGLLGAMAGCLITMRGVWFAPDYGWVWLFCGGLSASLARIRLLERERGAAQRG